MRKSRGQINNNGSITPPLLIVAGAFIVVIYALLMVLAVMLDFSHRQIASERALHIAEAGINYYRWHLEHAPADFQDGTGGPGPYIHEFVDPWQDVVGSYSLDIIPPEEGSSVVTIISTGWTDQFPNIKRTIRVKYGKLSLSYFAFLTNASAWYGEGAIIHGPIHSNNGIRMDGLNKNIVSSAKATYLCGSETGCSPPETKPGIWGTGGDQGLWQYPVPPIDFYSVSVDFANMRTEAQNNGIYLEPSGAYGYHVVFNAKETLDVFRVDEVGWVDSYSPEDGCVSRPELIVSETKIGTYAVTDDVLFAEDHMWIEGVLDGRMTLVAAKFPIDTNEMNIWIPDEVNYKNYGQELCLGIIAQHDVYFSRDVPDEFTVNALLLAQRGKIIRHGYFDWCGGTEGAVKNKLTVMGAFITYEKSYWNYGSGPESGFVQRRLTYDPDLENLPPPFFPDYGGYQFLYWSEE